MLLMGSKRILKLRGIILFFEVNILQGLFFPVLHYLYVNVSLEYSRYCFEEASAYVDFYLSLVSPSHSSGGRTKGV